MLYRRMKINRDRQEERLKNEAFLKEKKPVENKKTETKTKAKRKSDK